jgi:hypothetical protein
MVIDAPIKVLGSGFKKFKGFKGFKGFRWRLRRILDDGISRIVSLPLEGKVPRRGG